MGSSGERRFPAGERGTLAGKVLVVTGAAGDLGRAICETAADAGARVVGSDLGSAVATAAGPEGTEMVPCDVADRQAVDDLIEDVARRHGRLDGCVAAAGVVTREPALETTAGNWAQTLSVNLTGALNVCQASARAMGSRGGSMVLLGSWVGVIPSRDLMAYCVSKAAVGMLARCLALELAGSGIRVNVVAPGIIDAGLSARIFEAVPARRAETAGAVPLGRLGDPSDVATCVEFLLSDRSGYVTGASLVADGGVSLASASG